MNLAEAGLSILYSVQMKIGIAYFIFSNQIYWEQIWPRNGKLWASYVRWLKIHCCVSCFFVVVVFLQHLYQRKSMQIRIISYQSPWQGSNSGLDLMWIFICVNLAEGWEQRACKYGVSGEDEEAMMERLWWAYIKVAIHTD